MWSKLEGYLKKRKVRQQPPSSLNHCVHLYYKVNFKTVVSFRGKREGKPEYYMVLIVFKHFKTFLIKEF